MWLCRAHLGIFCSYTTVLQMTAMYQTFMIVFIPLFIARTSGSQISPGGDDGEPVCPGDRRTLWSIVWSCLATIFACTWLAVHPNVPGRSITTKGSISCAIERAKIMVIAILAPEIIVGWAAGQFSVAWKLCQGEHFISLGTLSDYITEIRYIFFDTSGQEDHDVPGTLVTLQALESEPHLVKNLAAISPETIEDKNKGDGFSKTISIFQLSWFIAQCVARVIQHLPITLLEMTALAGLSIITYSLWWYKPLNVKYHIS
ncbi:hypothetical protein IW262DRAFT_1427641, partial [Armillaria fumosa]